jgi:hypothetical protein
MGIEAEMNLGDTWFYARSVALDSRDMN